MAGPLRRSAGIAEGAVLDNNEQLFRLTFDLSPIGIGHVGLDGSWIRVNPSLCKLLGYTAEELMATDFQHVTHPDDLQADIDLVEQLLAGRIDDYQLEKRYLRKDGSPVWVRLRVVLRRDADGTPLHFISIVQDIHARKLADSMLRRAHAELEQRVAERTRELEHAMQELARLASHDALTGLLNRRGLLEQAHNTLSIARRHGNPCALLYFDLDGFKAINDRHGHEAGDAVLVNCAERIRGTLRTHDVAGRLGGDEFVVVLELTGGDADSARDIAHKLRGVLAEPMDIHGDTCAIGCSIGVVVTSAQIPVQTLMDRADRAMYRAKQQRSGVEVELGDAAGAIAGD